jgi:hypothetical protein
VLGLESVFLTALEEVAAVGVASEVSVGVACLVGVVSVVDVAAEVAFVSANEANLRTFLMMPVASFFCSILATSTV